MDINQILKEYDGMFGTCSLEDIEGFLTQKIIQGIQEQNDSVVFTLLNEIIGFCRDTMQVEKGLLYCQSLRNLINKMQLQGTIPYATSLLNIANAYRAFGKHRESVTLFEQTYDIYKMHLEANNFSYASLFNNWSLVYQEMGDFVQAKELLLRALAVVDGYPEAYIQQAVTRTNLASTILEIGDSDSVAQQYLQEALTIFEKDGGTDFHYGAALVAMGDVYFKKEQFLEAATYYQRGLLDVEKHIGRNDNYMRVYEKYQNAMQKSNGRGTWLSNMERSRIFYEQAGKNMIREQFPAYESRIAVGMVGEGSDCFGFDDYVSSDHDYAVGFCMWLTEEDFIKIGQPLQKAYEQLLMKHGLWNQSQGLLSQRRGVCSINRFYGQLLGIVGNYEKKEKITIDSIEEYRLAHATNGCVFYDELGTFSFVREQLLAYYADDIWRNKLAIALHDFSQYAQSNYPRMMARKDFITANLCVSKAVECAMDLVYLLNKVYAPYYKWKKKGLEMLPKLNGIGEALEAIVNLPNQAEVWKNTIYTATKLNEQDKIVCAFEKIAKMILEEMLAQKLVVGTDSFLELYVQQLVER